MPQPPDEDKQPGLSSEELEAQDASALPDREAMSTVGLDLSGIDNFAMPINEALAINNQSVDSVAIADADQTVIIGQTDVDVRSPAHERRGGLSPEELDAQDAAALPDREAMSTLDPTSALDGTALLDLDVNVDAALDIAAPVDAAVAANANAALPIDAAVSANVLSPDATSVASASQDSGILQTLDGTAIATGDQDSVIEQGETPDDPRGADPMSQHDQSEGLSAEELDAESAAALPDREAMSTLDPTDRPASTRRSRCPRCPACSTSTSTSTSTPTPPRRSARPSRPTRTSRRRSTPRSARTSCRPAATSMAVADQDSVIVQDLDGTAEASVDQDSTINQGEARRDPPRSMAHRGARRPGVRRGSRRGRSARTSASRTTSRSPSPSRTARARSTSRGRSSASGAARWTRSNVANAAARCTDCRATAIAFQVVLAWNAGRRDAAQPGRRDQRPVHALRRLRRGAAVRPRRRRAGALHGRGPLDARRRAQRAPRDRGRRT